MHVIALHVIALHVIALHVITLHVIALHVIALHVTALHVIALHVIALHVIALHVIALHVIALHVNVITLHVRRLSCIASGFHLQQTLLILCLRNRWIILKLMNFKYVDNTLSTFNVANVSTQLTGVHWQKTLYMGLFHKHPIGIARPQLVYILIVNIHLYLTLTIWNWAKCSI